MKEKRVSLGKTQAQIALLVGVSQSTYSRWEAGLDAPSSVHIYKLAKALDVSESELLDLLGQTKVC